MNFKKGDRVKYSQKPEWGLGQVLEDSFDNKVRIQFTEAGRKVLSLKLASLQLVTGDEAKNFVLDNLKNPNAETATRYRGIEDLKKKFLTQFADGFSGQHYQDDERTYKLEAHKVMREVLNREKFELYLASEDYNEMCKRALQIINKTNLIFPNERMSLADGLKSPKNQKLFAESLYTLLFCEGELEKPFNDFAACLSELGAAKWTIATYFLFIYYPEKYIFLKPRFSQQAAEVCGIELNYRTNLNWTTYQCFLDFAYFLKQQLSDLYPKDMIDVQSFIWCIAQD